MAFKDFMRKNRARQLIGYISDKLSSVVYDKDLEEITPEEVDEMWGGTPSAPSGGIFDDVAKLKEQVSALESQFKQASWQEVQRIVRAGLAEDVFPLGYEFATLDSDTGVDIVWRVVGHDHHKAADENLKHTMTLEMKNVYSGSNGSYTAIQFDAIEAVYYAEEGLAAGTYNFAVANQTGYSENDGKNFQFTLTKAVPVGGQIVFADAAYGATLVEKTVQTFASPLSVDIIDTAIISEGNGGTNIGIIDDTIGGNMNCFLRTVMGSNNYAQSALRQWINSAAEAGRVWTPTTKFDRPPTWKNTLNGFLHGLPSEFLEVVQPAIVPCRTNSVYEINSLDGTNFDADQVYNLEDKFFPLSRPEVYGTWDNASCKDGEVLAYYEGSTNVERVKYDVNGIARRTFQRSPYPSNAVGNRLIDTDGSFGNVRTSYSYGAVAACIIA